MSLVTDETLVALWQRAQAAPESEWPSRTFWSHLLSEHIFSRKDDVIAVEEPPSSGDAKRRIDIIVSYTNAERRICVLCVQAPKCHSLLVWRIGASSLQRLCQLPVGEWFDLCLCHDYPWNPGPFVDVRSGSWLLGSLAKTSRLKRNILKRTQPRLSNWHQDSIPWKTTLHQPCCKPPTSRRPANP